MLSCGEPSGDLYAGALTTQIRRLEPDAEVFGLGGERLAALLLCQPGASPPAVRTLRRRRHDEHQYEGAA